MIVCCSFRNVVFLFCCVIFFFFSSRRRHTRCALVTGVSDVCSSDLPAHYDLAMSRHWHLSAAPIFAFALLFYMLWSLFGGHLGRDLAFRRGELAPRHVWQDIRDHARLRFPAGEAALRYNVLQKASYIAVIFVARSEEHTSELQSLMRI